MDAFRTFYWGNVMEELQNIFKIRESNNLSTNVVNPYLSQNEPSLTQEELRVFLKTNNLLAGKDSEVKHPDKRYWPGEREER